MMEIKSKMTSAIVSNKVALIVGQNNVGKTEVIIFKSFHPVSGSE